MAEPPSPRRNGHAKWTVRLKSPWRSRPTWLTGLVLIALAVELRWQGRLWWCACGRAFLVVGTTHSRHTSQHLLDPYSVTHVTHGILFYSLLAWAFPRLASPWRFCLATCIEAAWEAIENTEFVIRRYRTATMAFGYEGDTVANALGDVACCIVGVWLARRAGWRAALAFVLLSEVILLVWIRDGFFLNVLMLIYPVDAIKQWQAAG